MTRRRLRARRYHGRPRKAQAKRRATTLAGRMPEPDLGSPELLAHRVAATTTTTLPNDLLGVLHGRSLLTADEHEVARVFGDLVRLVHLGFGLTGASPASLWRNILSATPAGRGALVELAYPGAERARRLLRRYHRVLGAELWHVLIDAVEGVPPENSAVDGFVDNLRRALEALAELLPRQRRGPRENFA